MTPPSRLDALTERIRPYGLDPQFDGPRWIASYGDGSLALGHGDRLDEVGPRVCVEVIVEPPEPSSTIDARGTVWSGLVLGDAEARLASLQDDPTALAEARAAVVKQTTSEPDPAEWRPFEIEIAGRGAAFSRIDRGSSWGAYRRVDDRWLCVLARRVPVLPAPLTQVTDIGAYA